MSQFFCFSAVFGYTLATLPYPRQLALVGKFLHLL